MRMGLIERLRNEGSSAMRKHYSLGMWMLCSEAADEIERMRETLEWINRQGGLGHDVHERIRKTLAHAGTTD